MFLVLSSEYSAHVEESDGQRSLEGSSFCPLPQIVETLRAFYCSLYTACQAGARLRMLSKMGSFADAVRQPALDNPSTICVLTKSSHIQQFLLPGLSWHREWETQINWNYKWVLVFAVECIIVLPMCAAYQQRCVSQMFTCASLRACACRTTGSH